ncbi:hypothetical protein E0H36_08490 [Rhizobium leguminosarum bv. viciae]|uniref:hypothetical protein n=1 Tax=Rhizobium leguminosarum TaxID=384 RepID=UPI00103DFCDA|nr:hypothetical protein [Rhizobium leguminosarum]MBY5484418.1 hypothetical protein [Rhizobium leguminosarum]TBZ34477.1 hypothetical protein E0H36_08490 [Rhizobium leguminosarum bv. viciae]
MFRKKTDAEMLAELELDRIKSGGARDYDDLRSHLSDNAYLYYMHHRLGWANKHLYEIRNTGYVLIVLVGAIALRTYGIL